MLLLYPSSDPAHHTVIHKSLQQCSSVHAPLLAIPAHSGCWQHTQRCYSSTPPMHSFGPSISILDGGCPAHAAALLSLPTSHSTDGSPHHPAFQSSPLCFAPAGGNGLPVQETNQISSSRAELRGSSTSRSKRLYHFPLQRAPCSWMAAEGTPRSPHSACSPPPRAFCAETSDQKRTSPSGATEGCHDAVPASPSLSFNVHRGVMEGKISRKDPKVSCQAASRGGCRKSPSIKRESLRCATAWQLSDYLRPFMQNKPACLHRLPHPLANKVT